MNEEVTPKSRHSLVEVLGVLLDHRLAVHLLLAIALIVGLRAWGTTAIASRIDAVINLPVVVSARGTTTEALVRINKFGQSVHESIDARISMTGEAVADGVSGARRAVQGDAPIWLQRAYGRARTWFGGEEAANAEDRERKKRQDGSPD